MFALEAPDSTVGSLAVSAAYACIGWVYASSFFIHGNALWKMHLDLRCSIKLSVK